MPSLDVGGVQTRIVDIANTLPGLEHGFLALDGRYGALSRLEPHVGQRALAPPLKSSSLPNRLSAYARVLSAQNPQLLLTYNWGSIEFALANMWTRIPHIHAEDGFGQEESERQFERRIWVRRAALRTSTVVVPSSRLLKLAKESWWIAERRLRWIPNGIDLKKFSPRPKLEARRTAGLPLQPPLIGWVGALRAEKNAARLLRAFARIEGPCLLVIVGEGDERAKLDRVAVELGIADRVIWLGAREDVAAVLPAFDVFALSSNTEQMPIVVMEAMAAGLPIASVNVGDIAAMVATSNAPFITEQSEAALSQALLELITDKPLRDRLGADNRDRAVAHFSLDQMRSQYWQLYSQHVRTSG